MIATASPTKRLAAFAAVSLGLHLMLMAAIRPFRPLTLPDGPDTVLQWVDLPAPPLKADRRSALPTPIRPVSANQPPTQAASHAPPSATADIESTQAGTDTSQSPPSKLDTTILMDAARAVAHEMALEEKIPPDFQPEGRPILPKFAQALQREAAGERYLGNGLIRIVTPRGQILCLQAPPDFARGGPAEMQSMQVNCPP